MQAPRSIHKQLLRTEARNLQSEIDSAAFSQQICQHIKSWKHFQKAKHILTYLAFGRELDLTELLNYPQKKIYVTRTHYKPSPHLSVHLLSTELERHPFGYLQPKENAEPISPEIIDLVLVPGLLFDKRGGRLGYGMGFYDRLLTQMPGALKLGITLERFVYPDLPLDPFDILMTHLATESGIAEVSY